MSGWDVSPEGVSSVLLSVGGHLGDEEGTEGLTAQIESFNDHVEEAAGSAASEPIGKALEESVEEYGAKMQKMAAKTSSAISGCSAAAGHYMDGNLEMAAEAQGNTGDISDLDL
ncbi:DUF6507 family protein [Allosalinactinospora lopnorensis]|uniref:DUF6507 family protein n=1 Tax=Allosalinactinospora lopnorensis TaxID=1352348 RepID=UPI000623CD14|nr:DUF6507 family protein [Allosalinactinospora lopnorensis]